MNDNKFTKLSELVGSNFRVESVIGYKFKAWNAETKRMEVSDTFQKGYRKLWQVETDKGLLDLGTQQFGNLLEVTSKNGKSDIIDITFTVKSNGKSGMDIRYYLNPIKTQNELDDNYGD